MKVGDKVYSTVSNQAGTIVCGPYMADNAMFLVADVRWDAKRLGRSTVALHVLARAENR